MPFRPRHPQQPPPVPRPVPAQTYGPDGAFPASEAVRFDPRAFDEALRSQGLQLVHYRALKCPAGSVDADDERHPHGDHGDCSNGFLYRIGGVMTCAVTSNSNNPQVLDLGVVQQATIHVTAPRFYDQVGADGQPLSCLVAPFDRLYLADPEIVVPNWERVECSGTDTESLSYPVEAVQDLVDAQLRDYVQGRDFSVDGGRLRWLPGGSRPARNADAGRQGVISVRYLYRPYWYVKDMLHEIRAMQAEDELTGDIRTVRLPQDFVAQREYVFENQDNDDLARDPTSGPDGMYKRALGETNLRKILAPRQGLLGPR